MGFGVKVLTGSVLALIGLWTVKLVIALVTGVMGVLWFLLTVIVPIVIGFWLIRKLFRSMKSDKPAYE
ncbi:MAG TPA: hypothetical protein VK928_11280 [Longimicrobiales bacterium]|nr:hypothetical protein [Longimicrobiales bacterium]